MRIIVETPVAWIDVQEPIFLDMNKLVMSIRAFAQTKAVVLGKLGSSVKLISGIGAARTTMYAATTRLGWMKKVRRFIAFWIAPGA